jgi:hypothetical protein
MGWFVFKYYEQLEGKNIVINIHIDNGQIHKI